MPDTRHQFQRVRFDRMAVQVKGKVEPAEAEVDRYVGLEHIDPESLRIRRWGDPSDVESSKLLFKSGDIIFGKRRAYQRKVAVADFDGICSAHAMVLRPKTDVVLEEFLPFFMESDTFMDRAVKISVGGLSPTINWKDLAKEEFALPPLEEQRRSAKVLLAIERDREALRLLQHSSSIALASLANSMFLNQEWPAFPLDSLLEYASDGPFGSKIKSEHYSDSGVRVVRLQNIDVNEWNNEDKAFVSSDYFKSALKGYEVQTGDVVVAGLGDERIPAGRACVVPEIATPAVNKADCFCLRPVARIDPAFLSMFFNSAAGLRQSAQFAQGTTRMRLNLGNIRRMVIPVPPMAEQESFVASMMSVMDAVGAMRIRASKVGELKSTFLDQSLEIAQR